jgi:hypothetical protein
MPQFRSAAKLGSDSHLFDLQSVRFWDNEGVTNLRNFPSKFPTLGNNIAVRGIAQAFFLARLRDQLRG